MGLLICNHQSILDNLDLAIGEIDEVLCCYNIPSAEIVSALNKSRIHLTVVRNDIASSRIF